MIILIDGVEIQIDEDDFDRVNVYRWKFNRKNMYVYTRFGRKTTFLHRYIMGADSFGSDIIVDHINRDRTNNRKSNLRHSSYLLNNHNKGLDKRNKSGHTGIKKTKWNSYNVCIGCNGKLISLGSYKTLDKAIQVRKDAEEKYWK